jgi:hydrogenase small subunit
MESNPTGCMGLPDYLGWQWRSKQAFQSFAFPGVLFNR